jgi:hypothetical protein
VALVRTDVSAERIISIIWLERIRELETTLAVLQLLLTANVVPRSLIVITLMTEVLLSSKRQFVQEQHSVTSQKTTFYKTNVL